MGPPAQPATATAAAAFLLFVRETAPGRATGRSLIRVQALTQPDITIRCGICTSVAIAGEIQFVRLHRGAGEAWREASVLTAHALCAGCLAFANGAIAASLGGRLGVEGPPAAHGDYSPNQCESCNADLGNEAYTIDIVSHRRRVEHRGPGRSPIAKHVGELRKQRVCPLCYSWHLSFVMDSASLRGTAARESEGSMGEWTWFHAADTASVCLPGPDASLLARTVEAMGRTHTTLRTIDLGGAAPLHNGVLFVGCTARLSVTRVVQRLPAALRARTVGVAKIDTLADAEAIVALGVPEILASPLSPHQVIGAIERKLQGGPLPPTRLGMPRHAIRVSVARGAELRNLLALRRLIRGFDQVVLDANGGLELTLYCPDLYLESLLRRLQKLLGTGARFSTAGNKAGQSFHAA